MKAKNVVLLAVVMLLMVAPSCQTTSVGSVMAQTSPLPTPTLTPTPVPPPGGGDGIPWLDAVLGYISQNWAAILVVAIVIAWWVAGSKYGKLTDIANGLFLQAEKQLADKALESGEEAMQWVYDTILNNMPPDVDRVLAVLARLSGMSKEQYLRYILRVLYVKAVNQLRV